jgi:CheY-like chemotaxis protein
MPGMTGLHAAREIARVTPHPPILTLSGRQSPETVEIRSEPVTAATRDRKGAADSDPAALQARAIEALSSVVMVDWTAHPGPLVLDERSGSSVWRRG